MRVLQSMGLLLGFGMMLSVLWVAPSAGAETNEELQQRVQHLEKLVQQLLDAQQAPAAAPATTAAATKAKTTPPVSAKAATKHKGLGFDVGTTRVGYGGYIKMDTMFNDYSGGKSSVAGVGEDLLVASLIPVGGKSGDIKFHASAKTSRFFFTTFTPTDKGHVNTRFELDALNSQQGDERISNSYASRIRHAFVNWQIDDKNAVLGGKTWSTFQNPGVLPDTLDFVGTIGTIFSRQPQFRYTRKTSHGSWQLSAENPSTTLYGGSGTNPYDVNSIPDIVARYNGTAGDFSYSLAGIVRELAYEDTINGVARDESAYGGALSFAGKWKFGKDDIRFMANAGNALGRYLGLNAFRAGQIKANGDIDLITQYGGYVAYRHPWSEKLRSSLVLSAIAADNPNTVLDSTPKAYQSVHVNLIYRPVPKLDFGGEYIWARRQNEGVVDNGDPDDEGMLSRLQISMKYSF